MQTGVVYRVNLLTAILGNISIGIKSVMLIRKLLTGENHRDANRRHQADEGEFDAFFAINNLVIQDEIKQSLIPGTLDVMAGNVIDGLRTVGESEIAAIDQFSNQP